MLLMVASWQELRIAQDTFIFLLQTLGFLINIQKPILDQISTLEFLETLADSQNMTLSMPQEKVEDKFHDQMPETFDKSKIFKYKRH